jgi:hypothetical protein
MTFREEEDEWLALGGAPPAPGIIVRGMTQRAARRRRAMRDWGRNRETGERRISVPVKRILTRWCAAQDPENLNPDAILGDSELRRALMRVFETTVRDTWISGYSWEQRWIEDRVQMERQAQIKLPPWIENQIRAWLGVRGPGFWNRISMRVRDTIRKIMSRSASDGLTLRERSKKIADALGVAPGYVSQRIARTESVASINNGQQANRTELGIEFKEWSSTIDKRTRVGVYDHVSPDGEVAYNDDAFEVSGELLLHPGDISLGATAGNVIQCRCAALAAFDVEEAPPRRGVSPLLPR